MQQEPRLCDHLLLDGMPIECTRVFSHIAICNILQRFYIISHGLSRLSDMKVARLMCSFTSPFMCVYVCSSLCLPEIILLEHYWHRLKWCIYFYSEICGLGGWLGDEKTKWSRKSLMRQQQQCVAKKMRCDENWEHRVDNHTLPWIE